ncbi:efflux RND transporter permease subunit [Litoribrevibacter albus]|uniref:Multidrug transporter AcrB n=1 Tax=Litoribrevibacter albus TaxID=1473156 RepID=A0AA37SDS6_9GAMM|nr:efflux RND transporter permease subunit [Litoribrevibacter albus]GLQ33293.1 multidrug transporter AcrB [Litoribrevibacter albus]
MDTAGYFINNKVTSWLVTLILLIGGILSFDELGRLEDPEFTIKDAIVVTRYPGASPQQVEEEVTYLLENAIQQLAYVDEITSISTPGLSQITVTIKDKYDANYLPQIWDELRRKVKDASRNLPPGVKTPLVNDDFGDVYGIMFNITGEGYSQKELSDYVDFLKRELVLVDGVGKVSVAGIQPEKVFINIDKNKLASLGISLQRIYSIVGNQNSVSNAGSIHVGQENIRLHPTGEFESVDQLENLLISEQGAQNLIYLGDVATVERGYDEIPTNIVRFNGQPAINVGVSFASGVNVVSVGETLRARLNELEGYRPIGIEIDTMYFQPDEVSRSISDFVLNLAEAVVIVIVVLLLFMGFKSGLLIGTVLFLTVLGTFIFMKVFVIDLQRISLGALIIALGMLVDNAIVVTEGILIGRQKGQSTLSSAQAIIKQTVWPLLGATIIAILAFAPIGTSDDATGEFCQTLFYVLSISLFLSWITAITITPFLADFLFKDQSKDSLQSQNTHETPEQDADENGQYQAPEHDPYQGAFFTGYKTLLDFSMRHRVPTMIVMVIALAGSIVGFANIKQSFFPPSTTPIFLIDYWKPQGTDIRDTHYDIQQAEQYILQKEFVQHVTATVGKGAQRFILTYSPEKQYSNYAQLIIRTDSLEDIQPFIAELTSYFDDHFPDAQVKFKRLMLGPSDDAKIEARLTGADPDVLRRLAVQVEEIMYQDPGASYIRHDWRNRAKVIRPEFSEARARKLGINKSDLDQLLLMSFVGSPIGLYRDGTDLLPIEVRLPDHQRQTVNSLPNLQVWSPITNNYVAISQVVSDFNTEWEDQVIHRRDRKRTLTIQADPNILGNETAAQVFSRLRPKIEAIELPQGYHLTWGGEFESSGKAKGALFGALPMGYLLMFIVTILLFSAVRTPIIIWACVPLAMIGIVIGFLLTGKAFGFMALLGMLSLSGMIVKNGIVLVDQINTELANGIEPYQAVFMSAVSRVRPVSMAAITTMLGMIPLLFDAFFESMAVVIIFGLGFATVLTLIVIPVLYTILYRIQYRHLSHL